MRRAVVVALLAGVLIPLTGHSPVGAAVDAWSPEALYGGTVKALAASPTDPSQVLAGTSRGGVFRSGDSGATWARSSAGLPMDVTVDELTIAASEPAVVYAGTERGMFRSADSGQSWSGCGSLGSGGVWSVSVDPMNSAVVLAASGVDAWRSTDSCTTWTATQGAGEPWLAPNVVAIAGVDRRVAYAFGAYGWRSTDTGGSWQKLTAAPSELRVASIDPRSAGTVVAGGRSGVWRSLDSGATWTRVFAIGDQDEVLVLRHDPAHPDTVLAGTTLGKLVRSSDGGATWADDASGVPPGDARTDIALTAYGPLLSTQGRGLFRRPASGTTWTATNTGLRATTTTAFAAAPTGGPRLYAGAGRQGVFRSNDSGQTYSPAGLDGLTVRGLAVSPLADTTVWAAAGDGLYRSTDGAASWVRMFSMPSQSASDVAFSPSQPATLYATTVEGSVYRSDDSGATWRQLGLAGDMAYSIVVHPTDPNSAWIGTLYKGVARTSDGGATWTDTSASFSGVDVWDVSVDPRDPTKVYAATDVLGIYRSADGGATWSRVTGGNAPTRAFTVVADPTTPGRVWAAGGGGPFVSQDSGGSWTSLPAGLTTLASSRLAVQTSGTAHLGTDGGGVFQYTPATSSPAQSPSPGTSAGGTSPSPATPGASTSGSPSATPSGQPGSPATSTPTAGATANPSSPTTASPTTSPATDGGDGAHAVPSLTVNPPNVKFGQTATVTVHGTAGATVDLYVRKYQGSFTRVRDGLVLDTTGTAFVSTRPDMNLRFQAIDRAVAQSSSTGGASGLVTVEKQISINVRRISLRRYTFTGSVNPIHPGVTVSLFRNGSAIKTGIPVSSARAYSFTMTLPAGTAPFQVRTGGTGYNNASTSSARSVRVY